MTAFGFALIVIGVVDILHGFRLRIHERRRGGGLVVGALICIVAGVLAMTGHISAVIAVVMTTIAQLLAVASQLALIRENSRRQTAR